MKIKPQFVTIFLTLLMLTLPQILTFTHIHAATERQWTFMVYLDADNDLEPAGIKDLNEMETIGSIQEMAIIAQMDRNPDYDSSNGNWTETRRYYVTWDNDTDNINSEMLENLGELNMGENTTLSDFAIWAIQNYSAQHYALVLWDHGGSSNIGQGACWDYTSNEDCLNMAEIKEALATAYSVTGKKIDVLAFDACLMGTIEVAYQIRDYIDYMVSSQETEPNDGYPYDKILADLATTPSMPPEQLAATIVNRYVESYTDGLANPEDAPHATSAAFNLTETSNIADAILELAEALMGDYDDSGNATKTAWLQAETFSGDFVDIYNFTQLLISGISNATILARADAVLSAVDSFVISEGHGTVHSNTHGVSIYYPKKYDKAYYGDLDFALDTSWDTFLDFATNADTEMVLVYPEYVSGEGVIFSDVAVGDVDGDGEAEIIAVGNYSDMEEETYFVIAVFDLTEDGLVQLCNYTWSLGYYEELLSASCADVDNDTIEEVVACGGYYNELEDTWYSYIGIFTVADSNLVLQAYDEGANILVNSLDVADVDGDDFPEIVISGYVWDEDSIYAYVAVGNNSAVTSLELECSYYWDIGEYENLAAVAVGDTDGDGSAEIVVGGEYYDYYYGSWVSYVAVLYCNENQLYMQAYDSGVGFWVNSVDVADVDGNGFNEIVISGYCWDYYYNVYMFIIIATNQKPNEIVSLGTYYWIVDGDSYICSIDVADVEGDGVAEIVAAGYYFDMETFAYESYTVVLSWEQTTGLVTENTLGGENQTYTYSVETENVNEDASTEIVTCSEEKGSSSRARIAVYEASNNIVTTGAVCGTVTDGENPIEDAVVEISIPRLSVVASVSTLEDGSYAFSDIPEGCYMVKVSAEGKVSSTQNSVIIEAGQTLELDFELTENVASTTSHSITVNGQTFYVDVCSNSTISNFVFSEAAKKISFSVYATSGTAGFCDIAIPQALLGGPYTIEIDGIEVEPETTFNGTHTLIHIDYTHSVHIVEISGTSIVPEFSASTILLLLAFVTSSLAILKRKTKKS
jgi:hypothetical protein